MYSTTLLLRQVEEAGRQGEVGRKSRAAFQHAKSSVFEQDALGFKVEVKEGHVFKCNVCTIDPVPVLTSSLNYVIIDMGLSLTSRGTHDLREARVIS